eukprot:968521-Prymnesium_polylepis.1
MTLIALPGDPSRRARSDAGYALGGEKRAPQSHSKNLTESVQVHTSRLAPFAVSFPPFAHIPRMLRVPPRVLDTIVDNDDDAHAPADFISNYLAEHAKEDHHELTIDD